MKSSILLSPVKYMKETVCFRNNIYDYMIVCFDGYDNVNGMNKALPSIFPLRHIIL